MASSSLYNVSQMLIQALFGNKTIFRNVADFERFLLDNGWDITSLPPAYASIGTALDNLFTDFSNITTPSLSDIIHLFEDINTVYSDVKSISVVPGGIDSSLYATFLNEFGTHFFDTSLINYIQQRFPSVFELLVVSNVIEANYVAKSTYRPSYLDKQINYNNLANIISDPLNVIKAYMNWASGFVFERLFRFVYKFSAGLGINASWTYPSLSQINTYSPTVLNSYDLTPNGILLSVLPMNIGGQYTNLRIEIIEYTDTNIANNGLIVQFSVPIGLSSTINITDDLSFTISDSMPTGIVFGVLIQPTGITFNYPSSNSSSFPDTNIDAQLNYTFPSPKILLGNTTETRLQLNSIGVGLTIDYHTDIEVILELNLPGLSLIIDSGDTDNFISKLFSGSSQQMDFPLAIRWSSKTGISFKGSGSLEFTAPVHKSIGPINIDSVTVALTAPDGANEVNAKIGASLSGTLGPLSFTVDNIGLALKLDLEEGNAGPFGISLGFKPPTGLGLAIQADPVSGGGFLNYDETTYTYTGALQLKFSEISLNAIGILTTKMPDGSNDYSLLILITADFTPVQLGMGFTLNGVGGLLGLNRTMNTDKLRSGVKDGSINNILFPQDVVANANTIISNISQAFPIQQDDFIIGPMAKIGWGTPTLLTIELGIMIQLPSPVVLAILGVVKAVLPTESAPVLTIQVNFLGVIDFGKKYLSFDASLFDSKILTFALTGDMALRLYWGDNPNFLVSVGGFHPKYTPPPTMNVPKLQRLSITLANYSDLQIKVQTYFAVTSNTAQFGASVSAMAKAWKIQAIGAVWFDVLFQFSPFHFTADMGAMFAIKMGSSTILSIYVDMTLDGPHPWRVQGKASFKVTLVRVHVSFNKTFGQATTETIAPAQIFPQLEAALIATDNWQVIGPDRSHQVTTFRSISVPSGQLVVDPFGTLRVSQKVVPLDTTITKFGNAAISDDNNFSIGQVTAGGTSLQTDRIQDYFSPNSFFYLNDDQKLSRASYELYNSGISIGDPTEIIADYFVHKDISYENIVLDIRQRLVLQRAPLSSDEMEMHINANYISSSQFSATKNQVPPQGPSKIKVDTDTWYVVADKNTLAQHGGTFTNMVDAQNYLEELLGPNANATNYMIVNAFELV